MSYKFSIKVYARNPVTKQHDLVSNTHYKLPPLRNETILRDLARADIDNRGILWVDVCFGRDGYVIAKLRKLMVVPSGYKKFSLL